MASEPLSQLLRVGAFGLSFLLLSVLERRLPLRREVEDKLARLGRNLGSGALGLGAALLLQAPLLGPVAEAVESRGLGLLNRLALPYPLEVALALVLLDYTLWIWHWLNHRVAFLWRFHLVHHVDLDLDASTGLRFHFGEMALSVPYRCLQLAAIGADRFEASLWQLVLVAAVLFHHSNLRLPFALERRLVRLLVTPRMHGIHHSTVRAQADSNYATLLTLWDRLHRTLRLNVPSRAVTIGVPAYRRPADVGFWRIHLLPFRWRRRPELDWVFPAGSSAPQERPAREVSGSEMPAPGAISSSAVAMADLAP